MDILTNSDYKLIFNNFPAGIFLLNSKCNIVRSNYFIESFLEYSKSDLNNFKFYNLINNADEKKIIKQLFSDLNSSEDSLPALLINLLSKNKISYKCEIKIEKFNSINSAFKGFYCLINPIDSGHSELKELNNAKKTIIDFSGLSSDFFWEIDTLGKFTFASIRAFDLLGYTYNEIIGNLIYDYMGKDEAKQFKLIKEESIETKRPFKKLIIEFINKSGQKVLVETSSVPVFNESGSILGFRCISKEISKSKDLGIDNVSLKKKIQNLFAFSDSSFCFVLDEEKFFVTSNISSILGYKSDSFISLESFLKKIIVDDDYNRIYMSFLKWWKSDSNYCNMDFRAKKNDGKTTNLKIFNHKLKNNSEKYFIISFLVDLCSNNDKRYSSELLSNILDNFPYGLEVIDTNGKIIYANNFIKEINGYTREEIIGKHFQYNRIITPEIQKGIIDTVKKRGLFEGEVLREKKSGEKYWEQIAVSPIRNQIDEISYYLVVKQNITSKVSHRNEVLIKNLKVENKNKVKSALFKNLSHRYRAPMNTILGFSDILKVQLKEQENIQMASQIYEAGENLLETLYSIIKLMQIDFIYPDEPFVNIDIMNVITDIIESYRNQIESKNLLFNFTTKLRYAPICANKNIIVLLLSCILDNSLHYTKRGNISIVLDSFKKKKENYILLSITDTGKGISESDTKIINSDFQNFNEEFFNNLKDTETKLVIAKYICEILAGSLLVLNIPLKGTTYNMVFHSQKTLEK